MKKLEKSPKNSRISKKVDEILKNNELISQSLTNEEQVESLGHTAWKYRVQGYSYVEIGKMMGLPTARVKHLLNVVRDEYKMEVWSDVEQFREDLVMQLHYMSRETQKIWEEIKRSGELVPPECIAYLESSRKMIKDIRDIMGLDAPKRTETQVSTGEQPYTINIDLSGVTK